MCLYGFTGLMVSTLASHSGGPEFETRMSVILDHSKKLEEMWKIVECMQE